MHLEAEMLNLNRWVFNFTSIIYYRVVELIATRSKSYPNFLQYPVSYTWIFSSFIICIVLSLNMIIWNIIY